MFSQLKGSKKPMEMLLTQPPGNIDVELMKRKEWKINSITEL